MGVFRVIIVTLWVFDQLDLQTVVLKVCQVPSYNPQMYSDTASQVTCPLLKGRSVLFYFKKNISLQSPGGYSPGKGIPLLGQYCRTLTLTGKTTKKPIPLLAHNFGQNPYPYWHKNQDTEYVYPLWHN